MSKYFFLLFNLNESFKMNLFINLLGNISQLYLMAFNFSTKITG